MLVCFGIVRYFIILLFDKFLWVNVNLLLILGLYILKFFGKVIFGVLINFKLFVLEMINLMVIVLFVFSFFVFIDELIVNFFIFLEKLVGLLLGNVFILMVSLGVIMFFFIFI